MAATNGHLLAAGHALDDTLSPTKEQQLAAADAAGHQRTYQACIPCRRRKVRCDLGSVDNPHDPPCKRCARESKECFFSATRRKKKTADAAAEGEEVDVYEIKEGRKRIRASVPVEEYEEPTYDEPPRTPGGSRGRSVPLRRPANKQVSYGEEDQKAAEHTTAILQAAEVHGGHDALKVLYRAALHGRASSGTSVSRPSFHGLSPSSLPPATSPVIDKMSYASGPLAMYQNDSMWKAPIDPRITKTSVPEPMPIDQTSYTAAYKAWSRFRFVRAGWLTAKEAMDYFVYFQKYLSPLTPVAIPDLRVFENHEKLLTQEPMLTVTILLIASRHMNLEGAGGASRPQAIHHKLWTYLSGMVNRLVWGQEQFGGGFCGAGSEPGSDVNPLSRKGLRTLGSVESLVLLTEWHPRAMHFPPDEDDDELMLPEGPISTPELDHNSELPKGIGGQRMDAWLEPCWRSDRLCWMLLGIAISLAFEIGVFDASDWHRHVKSASGRIPSAEDLQAYDMHRRNVRDLMLIYVTQTSGRLGLTSMLPSTYTAPEDSQLYRRQFGQHESIQETVLHFWLRMAAIMREGNQKIFANKAFTRDLIRNGDYQAALDRLQPSLDEWRDDFDRCMSIPKHMRCILEIEHHYCRVYLNALALQAVAERCANDHPSPVIDPPSEMTRNAITTNGVRADIAIDPSTLQKWLGGDRKYMVTVGDSARKLLKVVVDGLYPGEYLRHAPVRTYFRIISVAIMLLKSFSLGASESDVADSLALMDRTVEVLRTCVVDDVHVASRFADLLDVLTQNLKPRLVRIATDGRPVRSRRVSNAGSPMPMSTEFSNGTSRTQMPMQHSDGSAAMPPPWGYAPQTPGGGLSNQNGQMNPLYGISNDTYDLTGGDNTYSVMPPPSFGAPTPSNGKLHSHSGHTPGNSGYDAYTHDFNGTDDWLALPLDPLLNISGADVDQTMYGPSLGGQDMLELLLGTGPNTGF